MRILQSQIKSRKATAIPLYVLITLPMLAQIAAITSLVGYLTFRSGYQAIEAVAMQLLGETGDRITQELDAYLKSAQQVNRNHVVAVEAGVLDLQNLDQLHRYLILELQQSDALTSFIFSTPEGNARVVHRIEPEQIESGFTPLTVSDLPFEAGVATPESSGELALYSVDKAGNLGRLILTLKNFDIRQRPWYLRAIETGESGWSSPFRVGTTDLLAVNTYDLVYDDQQRLQGVFGVHLSLNQISKFLRGLEVGNQGTAFIIDRDGQLVAGSVDGKAYSTTLMPPNGQFDAADNQKFRRSLVEQSSNALIRGAAQHLIAEFGSFRQVQTLEQFSISINSKRQFLQVMPYGSDSNLDWLIVTIVPEYSFMADIYASLYRTAAASIFTLFGAIALYLRIARCVTRPIVALNQSAQAFERGEPIRPVPSTGIWEVDSLQKTFHQMASRLGELLHTLERQVQQRTVELRHSEANLKEAQRIAKIGSWVMDVATEKIIWSEELLQIYDLGEGGHSLGYHDFISYLPPEDQETLMSAVKRAIADGESYEIEHRFIRQDGKALHIVSRGEAVFNGQGRVVELVGTAMDISDRKQAELQQQRHFQEIAEWRDRYETAARASDRVLFEYDLAADEDTWGPNIEEILGYSAEEISGGMERYVKLIHPEDRERFVETLGEDRTSTKPYQVEFRLQKPDGTYSWVEEQGITRFNAEGQPIQVVGYVADISRRKCMELKLQALATIDVLTQVANRRQLEISLDDEWQRHRQSQHPLTLIMLDIDHFKAFNDTYGHPAGDTCLRRVAQALQTVVNRPDDLVARYGGEEFTLLLPNTDYAGAFATAQRIQEAIARLAIANPGSEKTILTVSMGIAVVCVSAELTAAIAMSRADEALYRAKRVRDTYRIEGVGLSLSRKNRSA